MTSEMERLDKYRSQVRTRSGPASYVDTGGPGRPVLFVHGVGTSSYLWRNVIAQLDGERRCVAVDLPLHGYTPAAADQDFTLPGLARFVADFCDALELTDFDMVANDTGGYIAGVTLGRHPLAPTVSPKKTWEGLAGSLALTCPRAARARASAPMTPSSAWP